MQVSAIIPVYNGGEVLKMCLAALRRSSVAPLECIVVDDGSTDDSAEIAESAGCRVLRTGDRSGPARARNLGALHARGDLLLFVDADVMIHPDAIERFVRRFAENPDLAAVMGSYDDAPLDRGFLSQFKNLMHAFFHQHGRAEASTFWCGCGAVRRSVYWEHGGLDDQYEFPSIEDIEFGTRLTGAGRRILLDPKIQCTHLKRWTLLNLVKTDVVDRAVPWTLLILRTRRMPRDLNLGLGQRIAGMIAMCMPGMLIAALAAAASDGLFVEAETWFAVFLFALGAVVLLNRRLLSFFASRRGWVFAAASVPMLVAYYWYSVIALGMAAGMFVVSPKTHVRNTFSLMAHPPAKLAVEHPLPTLKNTIQPPRVK